MNGGTPADPDLSAIQTSEQQNENNEVPGLATVLHLLLIGTLAQAYRSTKPPNKSVVTGAAQKYTAVSLSHTPAC